MKAIWHFIWHFHLPKWKYLTKKEFFDPNLKEFPYCVIHFYQCEHCFVIKKVYIE